MLCAAESQRRAGCTDASTLPDRALSYLFMQTRDIDMNPTEPYEHRMEVIVPHFIAPGVVRPVITNTLKTFARGQ